MPEWWVEARRENLWLRELSFEEIWGLGMERFGIELSEWRYADTAVTIVLIAVKSSAYHKTAAL